MKLAPCNVALTVYISPVFKKPLTCRAHHVIRPCALCGEEVFSKPAKPDKIKLASQIMRGKSQPAGLQSWRLFSYDREGAKIDLGGFAAFNPETAIEWARKRAKQAKVSTRRADAELR